VFSVVSAFPFPFSLSVVHYSRSDILACKPVPIGDYGGAMQTATCNECGETKELEEIDNPQLVHS